MVNIVAATLYHIKQSQPVPTVAVLLCLVIRVKPEVGTGNVVIDASPGHHGKVVFRCKQARNTMAEYRSTRLRANSPMPTRLRLLVNLPT